MKHDHRTQKRPDKRPKGLMQKLFAKAKRLPATATHEQDWETDVPSIKLSTAFMVILFLHVVVVGGVMLFRFMEKEADSMTAGYGNPATPFEPVGKSTRPSAEAQVGIQLNDPALRDLPRHWVRSHETLEMIANAYGVTAEAISRTNRLGENNPFNVGMPLVIPPGVNRPQGVNGTQGGSHALAGDGRPRVEAARPVAENVAQAREVSESAAANNNRVARAVLPESNTHTVANTTTATAASHVLKSGETLWAVAKRYGVSVDALLKANGISDARKVRDGTTLRVPAKN